MGIDIPYTPAGWGGGSSESDYDGPDDEPGHEDLCLCGRESIGDACDQCGIALCSMCFETGAGFCKDHPDENYAPGGVIDPAARIERLLSACKNAVAYMEKTSSDPDLYHKEMMEALRAVIAEGEDHGTVR